jgi:3-phosphoshikimate 1-carboxyvinyltransferase
MSLTGVLRPPGDKSICHRLGLVSLLARGRCRVENFSPGADCASTLAAVGRLTGLSPAVGPEVILTGAAGRVSGAEVDCGNSGTTFRLLMGLLAARPGEFRLVGDESLCRRPMQRVAEPLLLMGGQVRPTGGRPPVFISGRVLTGVTYELPVASAQLKSAVLLAGVQAEGVTTVVEPGPSRDHTERLLAGCGAKITLDGGRCRIQRSDLTLPERVRVPGDISSAAFFICAAAVIPGSDLWVEGVVLNPTRTGFLGVLARQGCRLEVELRGADPEPWGDVRVTYSPELRAGEVTAAEVPTLIDEVPILALTATQTRGTTVFRGVGELRVKETDRLAAVVSQLSALGADLKVRGDDLFVTGPTRLDVRGSLESFGDHRMAMTLTLAGLLAGRAAEVFKHDCVRISYPGFFDDLEQLVR